jgi:hypothetical protein
MSKISGTPIAADGAPIESSRRYARARRAACLRCVAPHARRTRTLALSRCASCHGSCDGERLGWLLCRSCVRRPRTRLLRLQHD